MQKKVYFFILIILIVIIYALIPILLKNYFNDLNEFMKQIPIIIDALISTIIGLCALYRSIHNKEIIWEVEIKNQEWKIIIILFIRNETNDVISIENLLIDEYETQNNKLEIEKYEHIEKYYEFTLLRNNLETQNIIINKNNINLLIYYHIKGYKDKKIKVIRCRNPFR
jgi:magnesium-transporting ATPase (P-type)